MKLLVLNPNSSVSMTDNLRHTLPHVPQVEYDFFTGPESSPPEIDGRQTSEQSKNACLPELLQVTDGSRYVDQFDGVLVACFSDHPLVPALKEHYSKPVLGIYQASILYALARGECFTVITSNNEWEDILNEATDAFFGLEDSKDNHSLYKGTIASNVNVLSLHKPEEFTKIVDRLKICIDEKKSKTVLLGCAGLSGMESKLNKVYPDTQFVDSVSVGAHMLSSICRFSHNL